MKKILITGSSGYIGSHLCNYLKDKYKIYGVDVVYPKVLMENYINWDIKMSQGINDKFDCVIHLAALVNVSESQKRRTDYYLNNVLGTLNVLHGVEADNFIFASTGAASQLESVYGISKRVGEDLVKEYCEKFKMDYTIFRFYNVIGGNVVEPTNPDGLFYNLHKAKDKGSFTIFGNDYDTRDGTCERDYVHVNEICEAIKIAIEEPANGLENLGHGIGKTVKEIVEEYKKVNRLDFSINYGPRRDGDLARTVLDDPSLMLKKMYTLQEMVSLDN